MKQKPGLQKLSAEEAIKDIRRATPRHWSAEDKIKIVLEGLRGEDSIAELCRREGIVALQHYGWPKEFLEAGKRRLAGDTAREATSGEVKDLRREMQALKEVAADLTPDNRLLKKKKHLRGWGKRRMSYSASEKAEIIRLVEQSDMPAKGTLKLLGIPRATFYGWYERYRDGGPEALADHRSKPDRV